MARPIEILYSCDKFSCNERLFAAYKLYKGTEVEAKTQNLSLNICLVLQQISYLQFMLKATNSYDARDCLELLAEYDLKSALMPELIPNKPPKALHTTICLEAAASSRSQYLWRRLANRLYLLKNDELPQLDFYNDYYDKKHKIRYLNPLEREPYRIYVHNGLFYKENSKKPTKFSLFDTTSYSSHGKAGYASFTIDLDGNMYAFNHLFGKDKIMHSSLSAGKPVFYSAEFKVIAGNLKIITMHSGHYKPKAKNVYALLCYLSEQGVKLNDCLIESGIELKLPELTTENSESAKFAYTVPYFVTSYRMQYPNAVHFELKSEPPSTESAVPEDKIKAILTELVDEQFAKLFPRKQGFTLFRPDSINREILQKIQKIVSDANTGQLSELEHFAQATLAKKSYIFKRQKSLNDFLKLCAIIAKLETQYELTKAFAPRLQALAQTDYSCKSTSEIAMLA